MKYRVSVYVQYDDCVEVEAESKDEAMRLAEDEAASNVPGLYSLDLRAYEESVEEVA